MAADNTAADVEEPKQRLRVANSGWNRWAPVNLAGIAAQVLQWVIPALTGAVLVLNARMGEQQRPAQVTGGLLGRLRPGRAA
jgi:hypothetical protein